MQRRSLFTLGGKLLQRESEEAPYQVRPPYGLNESAFQNECSACESKACAASCEEQIIVIGGQGIPLLNFTKSGCTFCEACAEACAENGQSVLSLDHTHTSERINARFAISTQSCVAHHGVICFSCKEPCIDDAILFNGMFNPVIDMDRCTGCGFCLQKCPTQAIRYNAVALAAEEGKEI